MAGEYDALTVTVGDGVWEITLDRPALLNRFDATLEAELIDVLRRLAEDTHARAGLLLAAGSAFSAGGDFDLMLQMYADADVREATLRRARRLLDALTMLPQPLVVGVQGAAMGLGATVALGGDVVVAARSVRLADTHVVVGLVAGDGGALFWPHAAGMLRARRYLLTGDSLSAEQAFQFGLVTDLVDEPAEVGAAARDLAHRIARLPPLAVRGTKAVLNRISRLRADEIVETALRSEGETLASADMVEAIAAFRERRVGRYEGR